MKFKISPHKALYGMLITLQQKAVTAQLNSSSIKWLCSKGNKGAVITEYVLLLFACFVFAMIINKAVEMGSNTDDSGWVIKTWMAIITTIADDM